MFCGMNHENSIHGEDPLHVQCLPGGSAMVDVTSDQDEAAGAEVRREEERSLTLHGVPFTSSDPRLPTPPRPTRSSSWVALPSRVPSASSLSVCSGPQPLFGMREVSISA